MMTEKEKREWVKKYYVNSGFTKEESDEYDYILSVGTYTLTNENEDFISRFYRMIESIIHNDQLDYTSKLNKLHLMIDTNKSLKKFYEDSYNFPIGKTKTQPPSNKDEDNTP